MWLFLTEHPFNDSHFPTVSPTPTKWKERGSTNSNTEVHEPTHNRVSLATNTLTQMSVSYSPVCPCTTHPVSTVVYYTTVTPRDIGFSEWFCKSLPCPRHTTTASICSEFSGWGCAITGVVILSLIHKKYLVLEVICQALSLRDSNNQPVRSSHWMGRSLPYSGI